MKFSFDFVKEMLVEGIFELEEVLIVRIGEEEPETELDEIELVEVLMSSDDFVVVVVFVVVILVDVIEDDVDAREELILSVDSNEMEKKKKI